MLNERYFREWSKRRLDKLDKQIKKIGNQIIETAPNERYEDLLQLINELRTESKVILKAAIDIQTEIENYKSLAQAWKELAEKYKNETEQSVLTILDGFTYTQITREIKNGKLIKNWCKARKTTEGNEVVGFSATNIINAIRDCLSKI